jgi:hypothetical protein
VPAAYGIEFQWRRWAKEGIADALLIMAAPPDAVSLAKTVRQEASLPVLLWRKMNPIEDETEEGERWSTYRHEAAQVCAGELDGYVVHAMITAPEGEEKFPQYLNRLWSVVQSAATGKPQDAVPSLPN